MASGVWVRRLGVWRAAFIVTHFDIRHGKIADDVRFWLLVSGVTRVKGITRDWMTTEGCLHNGKSVLRRHYLWYSFLSW